MRAKAIMIPPSRGMAPPLSPVPAPRPTMGMPYSASDFHDGRDVFRGAREDDHVGAGFVDAAVVLVKDQVLGAVEDSLSARADSADPVSPWVQHHAYR